MTTYRPGLTVVIPTIPPREKMLRRAMESAHVSMQRLGRELFDIEYGEFHGVLGVSTDLEKLGAARTRHRGLENVDTEWTAFLDDDDEFLPGHLAALFLAQLHSRHTGREADYLWSRFRIQFPDGGVQEGPAFLGEKAFSQWNDADPCQTTITTLVRTELAMDVGGFAQFDDTGELIDGQRRGEDHEFTRRCRDLGKAEMLHVPQVTWVWHHHAKNTSGLPENW
jgi:hypothetical protein